MKAATAILLSLLALPGCQRDNKGKAARPAGEPSPVASKTTEPAAPTPVPATASDATTTGFALRLYQAVAAGNGNAATSPLSVSLALAMTYVGARGETAAEMAQVLGIQDAGAAHAHFKELGQLIATGSTEGPGTTVHIANQLWLQQGFPFLPDFIKTVGDNYGAAPVDIDFRKAEAARTRINKWVAEKTEEKILDLIPEGGIAKDTRTVLTNAIYFKGAWTKAFELSASYHESFLTPSGETVQAPMMHDTGPHRLGAAAGAQVLALPYGNGDYAMIVVLPDAPDGLPALEKSLTPELVDEWIASLKDLPKAVVAVPRWKTQAKFELSRALGAIGMTKTFTDAADFSGITAAEPIKLSAVFHQVFVEVDEAGTTAAAATAVAAVRGGRPSLPEFRALHPFLYFIRHEKTGAILFIGRVADPTKRG